jgi:DNA repair exonuclease SbcCD nuclease subunit
MQRFKFVHAADLHLDAPFHASLEETVRQKLGQPSLRALERIVELAVAERADFVVLAGDLFDAKDRSLRAQLCLKGALERLDAAGVRAFLVAGNHDPLAATHLCRWPASAHLFGAEWEEVLVERKGRPLCRVQGLSHSHERVTENLSLRFRRNGREPTIGVLHANLGQTSAHAPYAPCSPEDLDRAGLDYWALGHVHTRAEHRLPGGGLAVYPGNPQARHVFEPGPRGCMVVDVVDGVFSPRFVATDIVRWNRLSLDITALTSLDALLAAAESHVETIATTDAPFHVARLTLTGQGPLHRSLTESVLSDAEEHLRGVFSKRSPPVFIESVRDETRPTLETSAFRTGGGLLGAVVELACQVQALADKDGSADGSADGTEEGRSPFADADLVALYRALARSGVTRTPGRAALVDRALFRALELLVEEER